MSPDRDDLERRLAFVQEAGRMKDVLRSGFTIEGAQESVAEHSWRLCLLAMAFSDLLEGVDLAHVLKLCVVHDLGEIHAGDVPAIHQVPDDGRKQREEADMAALADRLPDPLAADFVDLWREYEQGTTRAAAIAKGLDKIETMLTHNQGRNPDDFDYRFNLGYGRGRTDADPLLAAVRALVDEETERLAAERQNPVRSPGRGSRPGR